jgi:putative DNA primase/helicase
MSPDPFGNLDPRSVARALGGEVVARDSILCPGPGHSRRDRSLSIRINPAAPEGFLVHSFAGDDPLACREYARDALGLSASSEERHRQARRQPSRSFAIAPDGDDDLNRSAFALRLWREACDPHGTLVEEYLASRNLTLSDDIAGDVIRFHPALKFDGASAGAMVALFRDIQTNEPRAIHRTFLDSAARKLGRKMLGPTRNAAIKLDPDENVTLGLHIGEGIETCIAARLAGFRPVWALGSAGSIAAFPVLPGIEAVTILAETDDDGANHRATQACATRWAEAGREVFAVLPQIGGDLNDVWREVA